MKVVPFTLRTSDKTSLMVHVEKSASLCRYLHRHQELQISLIVQGEGTLIAGNYMQAFGEGDIYIVGENQPHMFRRDDNDPVYIIHIYLDMYKFRQLAVLDEFSHLNGFIKKASSGVLMYRDSPDMVSQNIIKIARSAGFSQMIEAIQLLDYFCREDLHWTSLATGLLNFDFSEFDDVRMTKIYRYTLEHYASPVSLREIASVANMTPGAFCKYFRKHTSKTYVAFLNEVRINEACRKLLYELPRGIASIAYSCGFNSAITFNRVFKKIIGKSPGEYVRECRTEKSLLYG